MIRVLHFADFHLGMENYGRPHKDTGINSRIHDFVSRLDEVVEFALEREVDLTIFAGDAFKNRQPNPTIQREFAHRVHDLAKRCPVVLLIGNHDLPSNEVRASSVDIYQTLNVPNVLVGDTYDLYEVPTPGGTAIVGTAPYPLRAQLLKDEALHGKSIAEVDRMLLAAMIDQLHRLAQRAEQGPADAPRILAGHFSVAGAQLSAEQNIMVGRDVIVPLGELDNPAWDYVALGHIHKHQNLTGGRRGAPPVVYSGSLERIDFGEQHDHKGFCWVELERGGAHWAFVPVHSRPFGTLQIDVRGSADPMERILAVIREADIADAVVRIVIQADELSETQIRDGVIYAALRDRDVHTIAGIKKEVLRAARTRLGGSPEGLSPMELLDRYFTSLNMEPDLIDRLLSYADQFLADPAGAGEAG